MCFWTPELLEADSEEAEPSYDYDAYYHSPLRRLGQSADYYYYYADELYPYLDTLDTPAYPRLEERQAGARDPVINPLAAMVAPLAALALIGDLYISVKKATMTIKFLSMSCINVPSI